MQFSSAFETLGVTSLVLGVVVMVGAFVLPLVHRHDESARDRADRLLSLAIVLAVTAAVLVVLPSAANSVRADSGPAAAVSPSSLDAS